MSDNRTQPSKKRKKARKGTFMRLMRLLARKRSLVVFIIITLVFSTIFDVFTPKVIGYITDSLQLTGEVNIDFGYIGKMVLLLAALYFLSALSLWLVRRSLVVVAEDTAYVMRQRLQKKLQKLPLSYLDSQKRGDVLARLTSDMVTLTNMIQTNLSTLFTKILTILGILVMMFVTNVFLGLIFIVLLPLSIVVIKIITKATKKLFAKQQAAVGELNAHIEEMVSGNDVMRAFNYEERSYDQMDTINEKFFKTYLSSRTWSGLITPVTTFLNNFAYIVVCVAGGILAIKSILSLGSLQAFLIYANNISTPINTFSSMLNQVQSGLAAADRIFQLLD
ncbi:MAG: ABC transporter ATP-binding protein, partial [Eubacterium sp.]|nr:ABC transporter ATP-binding protein [Eubacterium sp.]